MGPDKNSKLTTMIGSMQQQVGGKINLGEQSTNQQLYQKQLAATMAKLLGLQFTAAHPIGAAIY
jgi:hypothetical protein